MNYTLEKIKLRCHKSKVELADVLSLIGKNTYWIDCTGHFWNSKYATGVVWNFKKDLEGQKADVINFLGEVIK